MRFRRKSKNIPQQNSASGTNRVVNTGGTNTKISNTINPKKKQFAKPSGKRENAIKVKRRIFEERTYTFDNFDGVHCTYKCFLDGGHHPAIVTPEGDKKWYKMGKLHREDGPAVMLANGRREWYIDGQLHRSDGPAVIDKDREEFWINGIKQT